MKESFGFHAMSVGWVCGLHAIAMAEVPSYNRYHSNRKKVGRWSRQTRFIGRLRNIEG